MGYTYEIFYISENKDNTINNVLTDGPNSGSYSNINNRYFNIFKNNDFNNENILKQLNKIININNKYMNFIKIDFEEINDNYNKELNKNKKILESIKKFVNSMETLDDFKTYIDLLKEEIVEEKPSYWWELENLYNKYKELKYDYVLIGFSP